MSNIGNDIAKATADSEALVKTYLGLALHYAIAFAAGMALTVLYFVI